MTLWPISVRPHPVAYFGHVLEICPHVFGMAREHVIALGDQRRGETTQARGAPHSLDAEMVAAHMVQHDHVKGRGCRAFFHEAAHVEARCVGASMQNFVYGPRIAMKCEDDRLVLGKTFDEGCIIQTMRV